MEENTTELQAVLRGLLISNPNTTKANRLQTEFEDNEGRPFPFRKLGFTSFLDYLKSIPSVVELIPPTSHNPDVIPVSTKASSHIDKLVSKQRVTVPKKAKIFSNRSVGFHGRLSRQNNTLPHLRRRPPAIIPPVMSRPVTNNEPITKSNKGIYVNELENNLMRNYHKEDLVRNGLHSGTDLLEYASDMVKCVEDRVLPKMCDSTNKLRSHLTSKYDNCVPAESVEYYKDNELQYDDDLAYEDNDFWETVSEEQISNYTIQRCSQPARENTEAGPPENSVLEEAEEIEDLISQGMINNFRTILAKNPDGILATKLPQLYLEEFGVTLELQDLGYSSAITMASHLPNVFTYKRIGPHDWKLYDARFVGHVESQSHENEEEFAGYFDENDKYVPKSILENIKQLVKVHPEGFRSTSLLSLYENYYKKKLDLNTLGFNSFEDFLGVLKKIITVRKVTDYYLLLPKHKLIPIEDTKSNVFVETLHISDECIIFSGPENVIKPGDTIPEQKLPTISNSQSLCNEPLMELEIRVGEVISPDLFYILLDSKYNDLQSMMDDLDKFYKLEENSYQIQLPYLSLNLICACMYEGLWHRAKITGFRKNDIIEIEYIDYGTPAKVKRNDLRFLQKDFAILPSQSICAKLIGICPCKCEKQWPSEACVEFLRLVTEKRLLAQVYAISDHKSKERLQIEIILYDTSGPIDIIMNEYLIEKNLAEYINKPLDYEEKSEVAEKLDNISATTNHSTHPGQSDKPKSRPPPGFEMHVLDKPVTPTQRSPLSTKYSTEQKDSFYINPSLPIYAPPQQQLQINNYFPCNHFMALTNPTQQQLSNYFQTQPILNIPPVDAHNNQLYNYWSPRPRVYYPVPTPVPQFLPPQTNNNTYNLHSNLSNQVLSNQQYISASSIEYDNHNKNITQNDGQYFKENATKEKILGRNRDLLLPLTTASMERNLQPIQVPQHIGIQQRLVEVDSAPYKTNSLTVSDKYNGITNPSNLPLTTLSTEIINIHKINSIDNANLHILSDSVRPFKTEMLLNEVTNSTTSLGSPNSEKAIVRRVSCSSDEYASASEYITDIKSTKYIDHRPLSVPETRYIESDTSHSTVYNELKTIEKIPDSWEDIDPDDTPAKAEHFIDDFKKPLDFLNNTKLDLNKKNLNPAAKILNTDENKIENCSLIIPKTFETPVNWKDVFDPDVNNKTGYEVNIIQIKDSNNYLHKTLVEKIEIENKYFHLISVNNQPAVLSHEFYPQFVPLALPTISKILELKHKSFTTICKEEAPALFFELENTVFCGVSKRNVLKLGKTTISYLCEVPEVLVILKVTNQALLNKVKNILEELKSCEKLRL